MCRQKKKIRQVTHDYDDTVNEDNGTVNILNVQNKKKLGDGVFTNLKVVLDDSRTKEVVFQLDTGAACSIIGEKMLCEILEKDRVTLETCKTVLKAVNGSKLGVKGKHYIKIRKGKQMHLLEFIVVDYEHVPLLSYKACETKFNSIL